MNYHDGNTAKIAAFIKSGEKRTGDTAIGVEVEHFLVDADSGCSAQYQGENGVAELLEILAPLYDRKIFIDGHFLGLASANGDISLEPAAQFEISLPPVRSIREIEEKYDRFYNTASLGAGQLNLKLVNLGYHPKSKIAELALIPKARYRYMSEHMSQRGSRSLNMMKGSCATQVSIDFCSEEDFGRKMRLANCLTPVFAFMLDNTPVFEGVPSPLNMMRARIWDSVDPVRSGMIADSVDKAGFGYADYAGIMYGRPALMTHKDGVTSYTGDKTLRELFADTHMTEEDIRHALGMFFPDVRVKNYIEIRTADSVPKAYMLGYAALIKGLFYSAENIEKYLELFAKSKAKDIVAIRRELYNRDKKAKIFKQNVYAFCLELCADAENALGEEKKYLEALRYAMENKLKIYEASAREAKNR